MSSTLKILSVPPLLCTALLCAGCGKKAPEAERRWEMIRNDPGSVNRGEGSADILAFLTTL